MAQHAPAIFLWAAKTFYLDTDCVPTWGLCFKASWHHQSGEIARGSSTVELSRMDRAVSAEHCIREGLLPEELCRELRLLHLVAGVPGYRPNCTACTLLACPKWGWPALLRARELARDAAEDFFDEFGGLWPETTATVCWFPGSSLPVHTDNCKEYLSKRHVSVVIWLSSQGEDFEGGDFFFEAEGASGASGASGESLELVSPRMGNAALFRASERHGLRGVLRGARLALNIWFTRDPDAAEDSRLLGPDGVSGLGVGLGLLSPRLFGDGPQRTWPEDEASTRLAKRTLAQAGLPPRGRALRLRSRRICKEAGPQPVSKRSPLPPSRRTRLAVAAHRKLLAVQGSESSPSGWRGHSFLRLVRRRERQVRAALPRWHQHGLLSIGPLSSPRGFCRQPEGRYCSSAFVEHSDRVPGLTIARGTLGSALQRRLKKLADRLMTSQEGKLLNQSMRFGSDVPPWAHAIVRRTRTSKPKL